MEPKPMSWKPRQEFKQARERREESNEKGEYIRGIKYIRAWDVLENRKKQTHVLMNSEKFDS